METISRIQQDRSFEPPSLTARIEYRFKLGIAISTVVGIGVCLAWTSTSLDYLSKLNIIENQEQGCWVGSLLPLGAILGSLPVGILADKYGRKYIAWISSMPLLIGWFIICFVKSRAAIYAARFFAGIGCGASSIVVPMYFYEITNNSDQRRIVHRVQWCLNFGVLWSYAIYLIFRDSMDPNVKPFEEPKILLTGFVSFYSMAILLLPESPMWLEDRGRKEEAEKAIKKMTGTYIKLDIREPVKVVGNSGLRLSAFRTISNKRDVILILSLITHQQFSGMGPLTFFLVDHFKLIVHDSIETWVFYCIVFVPMLIAACCNKILHQCMGEKYLLYITNLLMAISAFFMAGFAVVTQSVEFRDGVITYITPAILLMIYLTAFQIGLGPIPWIMIGKMFPSNSRKMMYNLAVTYSWILLFITTQTYVYMVDSMGLPGIMLMYAAFNLNTMLVMCCMPNRVKEIQEEILENLDEVHTNIVPSRL